MHLLTDGRVVCGDAVGEFIPCRGDGYCWETAVIASTGMLEKPHHLTSFDYGMLSVMLTDAQRLVKTDHTLSSTADHKRAYRCAQRFLKLPADCSGVDLDENNYGGVDYYPILANLLGASILSIQTTMLRQDASKTYSSKKRQKKYFTAETPWPGFVLAKPNAKDTEPLSLRGVEEELKRKRQGAKESLIIVQHNGRIGARADIISQYICQCLYFTAGHSLTRLTFLRTFVSVYILQQDIL